MSLKALLLMVGASICACAGAQEAPDRDPEHEPRPFRGVVVLRDGGVLSGAIVRAGERYLVATASSEINVAASNVAMVCGTLEEAYERRRAAIQEPTPEAHLELAEWCLREDLAQYAANELEAARALDKRHPKIVLLERRLSVARDARHERSPAKDSKVGDHERGGARDSAASRGEAFRMVTSELPDGALERFTRKVQPLLVNSCALAGCHQLDGDQEFQLDRSLLHGMANRRSTTHNLQATLALVDRERPEESPLLTVPRRPHGNMEEAVFDAYDAKLVQQLSEWIMLVTQETREGEPENTLADGTWTSGEAIRGGVVAAGYVPVEPSDQATHLSIQRRRGRQTLGVGVAADQPALMPAGFDEMELTDQATLRPPSQIRYGVKLKRVEARDEFDPEIFNQRYGAQRAEAR